MRFKQKADVVLWTLAMALPLLGYIVQSRWSAPVFEDIIGEFCGAEFMTSIADTLATAGWNIPTFLWSFGVWVAFVYLTHLFIDVLLFLPRFGEKLAKKWWGGISE